jgi:ATP-dependent DNA helicase RecG
LAEVFQKLRLVERSGQGLDDIFYHCILEGKGKPNFIDTDDYAFVINIPAALQDEQLIGFMEEAINKKQISLSFEEVIELEEIRIGEGIKKISNKKFIDLGLVEKIGHGAGTRYILSHNFYQQKNEILKYTKLVGLSREKHKSLIVEHIEKNGKVSSKEIQEGFRELSIIDVNNIIQELKKSGKIKKVGTFKNAYWILNNS